MTDYSARVVDHGTLAEGQWLVIGKGKKQLDGGMRVLQLSLFRTGF